MTDCECPRFVGKTRTGVVLINHTYDCLGLRRGLKTMREFYGVPAARLRRVA